MRSRLRLYDSFADRLYRIQTLKIDPCLMSARTSRTRAKSGHNLSMAWEILIPRQSWQAITVDVGLNLLNARSSASQCATVRNKRGETKSRQARRTWVKQGGNVVSAVTGDITNRCIPVWTGFSRKGCISSSRIGNASSPRYIATL